MSHVGHLLRFPVGAKDATALAGLHMSDQLDLVSRLLNAMAPCICHMRRCTPSINNVLSCAGTPCQDFSSKNRNAAQLFGPRGWVLLAFLRSELVRGTAIILQENVVGFDAWFRNNLSLIHI